MTEDDTFKILRRSPFEEMKRLVDNWFDSTTDIRAYKELLSDHGWTYDDFCNHNINE